MHQIKLVQPVVDSASAAFKRRRARPRIFEKIDSTRTAHVIIDMQNGYVAPGAAVEIPIAREIVPNVNEISKAVRATGGVNIFVQYTTREEDIANWSIWYSHFHDAASQDMMRKAFAPNSQSWSLWPELDVTDQDLKVEKSRFSAFVPGTCELHSILQARNIETVIITGVATNCCCESTARDAMQLNYKVIVVADGNAALTDDFHNASLNNLRSLYADIAMTEGVVDLLRAGAQQKA
ncbi:MAG: isochorismatase family cysteine hydrolase [Pseudomonadota bacterium]|nr:isochorismatase family cysteine hydrolase [Pseudomonadota bacterium]